MKKTLLILLLLFTSLPKAQSHLDSFINYFNSIKDSAAKSFAVDSFMNYAERKGIPLIENDTAAFIYKGKVSSVNIAGDFTDWKPDISMQNLAGTNFFYYSKKFEPNARLDYKLILDEKDWILDPNNPKQILGGFGPNSELAMPEYVQPWEIKYQPNVKHGKIINKSIKSVNTNSTFQLKIYFPPGYDSTSATNYPTVYFQDGFEYITLGSAVNVIDNLLNKKYIEPVVAVFIKPNNRNEEYAYDKRREYESFFIKELVPFIDKNFNTIKNPSGRLIIGDSFGGNISALISYDHPEIFGNCGLHSGAFWPNKYEVYNLIVNGSSENINYSLVWGSYESLDSNLINFKNKLKEKEYKLEWFRLPEGHSWGLWRANIDRFLIYFFPNTMILKEK